MTQHECEPLLRELHRSLDERWRPEDIAQKIVVVLPLVGSDRKLLQKAAKVGRQNFWSSMSMELERPGNMSRQLKVAEELFGKTVNISPDDVTEIEKWIKEAVQAIGKGYGRNDFKQDRLPKSPPFDDCSLQIASLQAALRVLFVKPLFFSFIPILFVSASKLTGTFVFHGLRFSPPWSC